MGKRLRDRRGMTLVETIVGLAVLSLALSILYLGFFTAGQLFSRGGVVKNKGQHAAGVLEGAIDPDGATVQSDERGQVTIKLSDGSTLVLSGNCRGVTDAENGQIHFYKYDSDSYQKNAG